MIILLGRNQPFENVATDEDVDEEAKEKSCCESTFLWNSKWRTLIGGEKKDLKKKLDGDRGNWKMLRKKIRRSGKNI